MGAVVVVVGEVALELAAEAVEADVEVAGKGGPPALVEDGLVDGFDGAVRLRPAGIDAADLDAVDRDAAAEALAAKLLAVVGEDALEAPACCA